MDGVGNLLLAGTISGTTGRTDAEALRELFAKSSNEKELVGGPDRDRTGDLMNAIHARSQLRYWPISARGKLQLYGVPHSWSMPRTNAINDVLLIVEDRSEG